MEVKWKVGGTDEKTKRKWSRGRENCGEGERGLRLEISVEIIKQVTYCCTFNKAISCHQRENQCFTHIVMLE